MFKHDGFEVKSVTKSETPPTLLIVVPTLESFLLLRELVESLKAQSFCDWRLVFVDGPSSAKHRRWIKDCVQEDKRISWVEQDSNKRGIFGAMNQGFALAAPTDYVMFWGSDDLAASPDIFKKVVGEINETIDSGCAPDMVVCRGRYFNRSNKNLTRRSGFLKRCLISSKEYRNALFSGLTPPHQATLLGPGIHTQVIEYSRSFLLAADLDYFLRLSTLLDLNVLCLDVELVHMESGGISSRHTSRRLREVLEAYYQAFGLLCWIPFLSRYLRKINSNLQEKYRSNIGNRI
jgi:glycosyltransferase involved in cell wall biosynthesis